MMSVVGRSSSKAYYCNWFSTAFIWWAVLLVLTVAECWKGCNGCLETERMALLQIKSFFNNPIALSSWRITANDDCCDWDRVSCDDFDDDEERVIRRRSVTALSLDNLNYRYPYRLVPKQRLVNASLFLPFQQLGYLSLQGNGLVGCMENQGFEKLSALVKLRRLSIPWNHFGNSVMSSLTTLSSLTNLDISRNALKGTIDMNNNGFGALINLETLNLLGNNISVLKGMEVLGNLDSLLISANNLVELQGISSLTRLQTIELDSFSSTSAYSSTALLQNVSDVSSLRELSFSSSRLQHSQGWRNLQNLEILDIWDSIVDANFLNTVGIMMTNLTSLRIFNSPIDSTFPQALCNLSRLQSLSLVKNNLTGELPQCLSNLTSLKVVEIDGNQLRGDIAKSPLTALLSLEEIRIYDNEFRIPLSFTPFFNHSRLKIFDGYDNLELYRDEDDERYYYETTNHTPLFQLELLWLSSVNSGDRSGSSVGSIFPKFLYYQTNLSDVTISDVKMIGGFPWWLLANNTNLRSLFLINCSLSGSFQLPIPYLGHPHERLYGLGISGNDFSGSIPPHLCAFLPGIAFLYLANNHLSGTIPGQLTNCSSLELLDARNNTLSGEIPTRIWNMSQLTVVALSSNNLSGSLPPGFISPRMVGVHLSRNKLGGVLSGGADHHADDFQLQVLDLSHNQFTGTFPEWTAELPRLTHLLLSNNELQGEVGTPLCLRQLKLVDVSHNRLSGRLSSAFTSNHLKCNIRSREGGVVYIDNLEFVTKTILYTYKGTPLQLMAGLDFSSNNFTGVIPPQIGLLGDIKVLNLSYNMLTGPIPATFSGLTAIESLDLSHNNLSGAIPPQLIQLNSLTSFSVAYNNLSGRCPQKVAQFATFDKDSYRGNPLLINCTLSQSTPKLPATSTTSDDDDDDDDDGGWIDMESFYASGGVSFVMVLLVIASVLYINPYWRQAWFYYVGVTITTCYYFVVDHLPVPVKYKVLELRV